MDETHLKFYSIQLEIGLYTKDWKTAEILREHWYSNKEIEFQGIPYKIYDQKTIPGVNADEDVFLFKLKLWWTRDQLENPIVVVKEKEQE